MTQSLSLLCDLENSVSTHSNIVSITRGRPRGRNVSDSFQTASDRLERVKEEI